MTNTSFSANGLSIQIFEPIWRSGIFFNDYSQQTTDYSHTIGNMGGFLEASLGITEPISHLEDWLDNGLGRKLVVYAGAKATAWEGFVNQIDITVGGLRKTLGPFLGIANRIKVIYSSMEASASGLMTGIRVISPYVTNQESIDKYGTITRTLSTSGVSDSQVTFLLNATLDKLSQPGRSEDLSIPSKATSFQLKLGCVGFQSMLGRFPYNNSGTNQVNLSDKIKAILQAEPNAIINTDLSGIELNTLQVSEYEQNDTSGVDLIKGLINQGDASGNRFTFGVYEDRKAIYRPVTQIIKYIRPLREPDSIIQDMSGAQIQPWEIRPGYWIWVADLLPAKRQALDLDADPRAIFAETVSYRAPNSVTINGAHNFIIEQKLNQLGIGGFS